MSSAEQCKLSVIVAVDGDARSVEDCVGAIRRATRELSAEIIVARRVPLPNGEGFKLPMGCTAVEMPAGTLIPGLWSAGLRRAGGNVVAFTTTRFRVGADWAKALLSGVERGWAGVGGNVTIAPQTSVVDWAVYYLRYSAFIAQSPWSSAREIAGDNAAYTKVSLDRHAASFSEGFWEVEFHAKLRRDGESLGVAGGAEASFVGGIQTGEMFAARFEHGRHFARWRIARAGVARPRVIFGAPLVPALLVARIARRVLRGPEHRWRFALALPALVWFAVGWAAGELWGAALPSRAVPLTEVAA